MPDPSRRRRAAIPTTLALSLLWLAAAPGGSVAQEPPDIERFMVAVGRVESGDRYDARNAASGAYGRYQILPSNWPSWAGRYLGNPGAPWTPANQDAVARGKMRELHAWLGDWRHVAHWWLTGAARPEERWSSIARNYVAKVMAAFEAGLGGPLAAVSAPAPAPAGAPGSARPAAPRPAPTPTPLPALPSAPDWSVVENEDAAWLEFEGDWIVADHPGYSDGTVASSNEAGARVAFSFVGRGLAWFGPAGPTRGSATVYVDGEAVAEVSTHARRFTPRVEHFRVEWEALDRRVVEIVVHGTAGRPTLAIDAFEVLELAPRIPGLVGSLGQVTPH